MGAKRKFVCVVCPRGCALEVETDEGGLLVGVSGNACRRGEDYARSEIADPRRVLTTTVAIRGAALRRLPVKTAGAVPLGRLVEVCRALDGLIVEAPVACGDVILRDLCGLGVDLVATDSLERA